MGGSSGRDVVIVGGVVVVVVIAALLLSSLFLLGAMVYGDEVYKVGRCVGSRKSKVTHKTMNYCISFSLSLCCWYL